jgi:hypothetical protein
MAISFEDLRTALESAGIRTICDPHKQIALCLGVGGSDIICLAVRLIEDGEAIHFMVPRIAMVTSESKHRDKIFEVLLVENHFRKVGRACWDPSDGEVYLDWFHSIEDGTVTADQLRRCVTSLFVEGMELGRRINHILKHGTDLPEEERGLRGLLRHLAEEVETAAEVPGTLREFLEELKRASGDPGRLRNFFQRFKERNEGGS